MEGRLDGLGSYLAQRSLDDLSYFHLGKEGNLTILVKHGDMYRADEPEEEEQKTPASEPKPVPEEYAVRIIEEQDAYEIARCAYRAYGYGYEMFIYYPERIIQMNRAGLLHSVVAVLPNDELLGHLGIKVPVVGASVAEMGVGFVNPEYRGGGVFKRMHALVFDVAKENNLMGLFVHAVTNHVFSQKAGSFFGLKNCALLLAKLRTNDKFIGIGENTDLRLANLVMHILLIPSERETLYVPEQHQEMVQRIMGQFGFSGQIVSNTDVIPDAGADTVMRSSFQKEMNYNEIFVEEIGENWESNLRSRWKHCLLEKQDVIYLYLDMANPMTPRVCEVCESWGFFFAGVLPNALREHDALILQYLNHQQVVPDQIHLHDDFAQELLDYICKQPPVVELLESQGKGE